MRSPLRWALALIALWLPALAILVTALLWRGTIPERVATHWSDLGVADGSAPTGLVFIVTLAIAAVAAVSATVVATLPRQTASAKRAALFWLGVPAGVAAACWLVPAWLTLQAGTPERAVLGAWIIPLVLCILAGAAPYAIAPRVIAPDPATAAPTVPLGPTETGAWTRTVTASVFVYAIVAVLAITAAVYLPLALAGALGVAWFGLVILLVAALVLSAFVRLRVTVDWRGLRVVSLLLGIPLKRIPLERIRSAEAAALRPGEWGGWGYRFMPGRSALILRAGPGLIVTGTNDTQFAITVTDPDTPAGLLNTLRQGSTVIP